MMHFVTPNLLADNDVKVDMWGDVFFPTSPVVTIFLFPDGSPVIKSVFKNNNVDETIRELIYLVD